MHLIMSHEEKILTEVHEEIKDLQQKLLTYTDVHMFAQLDLRMKERDHYKNLTHKIIT